MSTHRLAIRLCLAAGLGLLTAGTGLALGARVLVNHVGYDAAGPKRAVIQGRAGDAFSGFKILDGATGREALSGMLV
ncbi:MAG: hypothetical protein MUQ00_14735, partial [Candidatus Aminicenantes bacterium]|nr:hypothetical protein [Candidatus Aminicenantes bacterium]